MVGGDGPAEIADAVTAQVILGPTRDVAVDFHGRCSLATAKRLLPQLTELAPLFAEASVPRRPPPG